MTLNLEQIPISLTEALQRKAAAEGKSLPEVALEAMAKGLGVNAPESASTQKRDLTRYRGQWIEDPAVDEALKQFERVDEEQWR